MNFVAPNCCSVPDRKRQTEISLCMSLPVSKVPVLPLFPPLFFFFFKCLMFNSMALSVCELNLMVWISNIEKCQYLLA